MSPALSLWWAERSFRERRLLIALAVVAAVALLLVAIVRPLQATRGEALADIRTYQTLSARLRAVPPGMPPVARRTGDAASIISTSAASFGLSPRVNGSSATLAAAPYDATLRWIADVEATSAFRVDSLSMTATQTPGVINLRVTFR